MAQKTPEELAKEAKGNIDPEELTETESSGFLSSSTLLYDGPILSYLNDGETPHFLFTNKKQGFRIYLSDGSEETPHHNLSGKKYLLISDQRILYVAGCSDGDKIIEFEYSDIVGSELNNEPGRGAPFYFSTTDGKKYKFFNRSSTPHDSVVLANKYVNEQVSTESGATEDSTNKSEAVTEKNENFYFTAEIRSPKVFGEYEITVDNTDITIGNDEYQFIFSELAEIQEYSHFAYNNEDPSGIHCDGIKIIDSDGEEHYIYREGEGKEDIPEDIVQYIRQKIQESENVNVPYEYSLCGRFTMKNPELKVDGWADGSSSIEADLDASASSKGKSKGVELGPFTRSKTSSNSSIDGEISGDISDNTYTTEVKEFRLYEDHFSIDSGLELDIDYSDIDNVFKVTEDPEIEYDQGEPEALVFRGDGVVIQVGPTTFRIENLPDNAPIDKAIEFIRSKMTGDKGEGSEEDESNDNTQTEKIREIKELYDDGIITEEEFDSKKEELLDDF